MRPRSRVRCQWPRSQPRLVLFLLGLVLILAPAVDGAVEVGPWNASSNSRGAQGLDLCAVPGLISILPSAKPAQLASPLVDSPTMHLPSPLPCDRDHPPRAA